MKFVPGSGTEDSPTNWNDKTNNVNDPEPDPDPDVPSSDSNISDWIEYTSLELEGYDVTVEDGSSTGTNFYIPNYEVIYTFEQLQSLVLNNGWTGMTLRDGNAYFKKIYGQDQKFTSSMLTECDECVTWIYNPGRRAL